MFLTKVTVFFKLILAESIEMREERASWLLWKNLIDPWVNSLSLSIIIRQLFSEYRIKVRGVSPMVSMAIIT